MHTHTNTNTHRQTYTNTYVPLMQVSVGSPLYKIDISALEMPTHSESTGDKPKPVLAPVESAPKILPVMVPVPVMGESITQGVLASWSAKSGLVVAADEVIGMIETDKVT